MQGRAPRRDTSSFRGIKVVPPLCFGLECGLSGDASLAYGNAAEDSVVNEAPRLPSITEGLSVHFFSLISHRTQMVLHHMRCQSCANDVQDHHSLFLPAIPVQGSLPHKLLLSRAIVNPLAMHVACDYKQLLVSVSETQIRTRCW